MSPLAAASSNDVAIIYICIFIYTGLCFAIGFKIGHARWKDTKILGIPPRIVVHIVSICFSILFLVILIPYIIFCCLMALLLKEESRDRWEGWIGDVLEAISPRRSRDGTFTLRSIFYFRDSSPSNTNRGNESDSDTYIGTSISSHGTAPPDYIYHRRDAWVSPSMMAAMMEYPPEIPPPAYISRERL
ncbi:hypothetical protein F5Y11DRAFT_367307 [Daldinia sp. FL1419]|nr:hypothetical protein F5Y11DRAFT_367307 [Daldinia sp. FL1419]